MMADDATPEELWQRLAEESPHAQAEKPQGARIRSLTFCAVRGFEKLGFLMQPDLFRAL